MATDPAMNPMQFYTGETGEPLRTVDSLDAAIRSRSSDAIVDPLGISQMVAGSGPLAGRTLIQGIRRLQPGEELRGQGVDQTLEHNNSWYDIEPDLQHADSLRQVLREVINELPQERPLVSLLSGGWDSRLLLALAVEANPTQRIQAYTTSSDTGTILEELVAAQVASELDVSHEITPARRDQFAADLRYFASAVGYQTSFHVWLVPIVRALKERYGADVEPPLVLDGLGGGLFVGGAFADGHNTGGKLASRVNSGTKYLDEPQRVLKPQVAKRMREHIGADLEPAVRRFLDHPHGHVLTAFVTRTWPGISLAPHGLVQHVAEPVTPFTNLNVIREGLRISPEAHSGDRLYARLLTEISPRLASLPTAQEQVPWPRPHPRRITSIEAIRELRRLIQREPVAELVSPQLLSAPPKQWRALLGTTNGQHLIRGLATLSLWLETYGEYLVGFDPREWTS